MRSASRSGSRDREAVRQRVYATVDAIPRGRVATYGQVAREAGLPRRARLIGRLLSELPEGSELPWHRVINARGAVSQRGGSDAPSQQRARLEAEGVEFDAHGRVALRRFQWDPGL